MVFIYFEANILLINYATQRRESWLLAILYTYMCILHYYSQVIISSENMNIHIHNI